MDSVFLGRNASSFRRRGQTGTISKVTLVVDEENFFTAGDDTGDELTADCAWATQDMADAVLAQVGGKQIPGFTADEALLDISTEVGDGLTVCDTYSVAASIESTLDLMDTASVALSVSGDVEQEYAAAGSIERKIARVRKSVTQLTVKAGEISAEITNVENELSNRIDLTASGMDAKIEDAKNGLKNEITATANSLSANISATDGRVTALSASLDSMTLSVSNGSESSTISLVKDGVTVSSKTVKFTGDVIFASDLTDGTTMISGNNILTGTISADRLDISGAINNVMEDGVGAINFVYGSTQVGHLIAIDRSLFELWAIDKMFVGSGGETTISSGGGDVNIDGAWEVNITSSNGNIVLKPDGYVRIYATSSRFWEFRNTGIYYCSKSTDYSKAVIEEL